jgi:hypothetical protein
MEVPTESLDKSLLEFNNLLSPANLRVNVLSMSLWTERTCMLIVSGRRYALPGCPNNSNNPIGEDIPSDVPRE